MTRPPRILVIDDHHPIHGDFHKILAGTDRVVGNLAREAAELFGDQAPETPIARFDVDSAYQGAEGVNMAAEAKKQGRPYAMAFVDMRMPPGWDGVRTTQELWAVDPDVQVVICTAYSACSWNDLLAAIGDGDRMIVLKKPFEPVEVLQMAAMLTRKWELQKQARQKLEDLERMVEERTRDLKLSNEELRRKTEEIQFFYHTLSHELKTPLTSAREFISIVADGLAGPVTDEQAEYLGIARESCSRLGVYINDLFDATRLDTGKLKLQPTPTSIRTLAQQALAAMRPAVEHKGIRLSHDLGDEPLVMNVDGSRVMQILNNLLANAVKFTQEGGTIKLSLSGGGKPRRRVELSVSDTGCGIPEDQLDGLFSRYFQAENATGARSVGVGLGLYLCRELAQLHDGDIRVQSTDGEGSTFTLTLPADRLLDEATRKGRDVRRDPSATRTESPLPAARASLPEGVHP